MNAPYVYDKAKYHFESIEGLGLPREHSYNHTVPILRWLIEREFMSDFFKEECADVLAAYKAGDATLYQLYESWDCCLIDDMVNEEGNAFGKHYFDFQKGQYISDYIATLQGTLPSEFHVVYTEENYAKLKSVIDRRFNEWKNSKSWWRRLLSR